MLGYTGVGRAYGVSDNAVRKWRRAYEAERGVAISAPCAPRDAGVAAVATGPLPIAPADGLLAPTSL
jgi:transposase-like protein